MKKLLSLLLIAVLALGVFGTAQGRAVTPADTAAVTNNEGHWEYWTWRNWSQPVRSYLYDNGDGTVTRVEYTGSVVAVEVYNTARQLVSAMTIQPELPLFGGFFAGSEYNFLVFGQENLEESDSVEVIRTVKYSKDWTRLGSASLYGENTYRPFEAGSLRMAEYGGYLFVRTCHKMYASNGVNHQANLSYIMDIAAVEITDCWSRVANISWGGYCSHSFNQFIAIDGNKVVALDHGDAHPRSAVLVRYRGAAGSSTLQSANDYVETMVYPGSTGDNYTYSCIGGLEVTSCGYMTVGNTSGTNSSSDPRNVYITVTDRNDFTANGTRTVWLTSYSGSSSGSVSNPQLIKINDDKLMVLWKENGTVRYVFVDGSGDLISEIKDAPGYKVSDCQPVVIGDNVEWYVTSNSAPVFYTIGINSGDPGDVDCDGDVDFDDVTLLNAYLLNAAQLSEQGLINANVNGDNKVSSADVVALNKLILGSN